MESTASSSHATSSLGEELKRRREERGLTLRQISDTTRINMRFLQAIEADNYRVLPGAMFNRRFVAALAKQVGMNEDEAVRWYVEQEQAHPDDDSGSYIPPSSNAITLAKEPKSSRGWVVVVVILLLAGLGYGGWKTWPSLRSQFSTSGRKSEPAAKPAQQPSKAANQPTPQPNQQPAPQTQTQSSQQSAVTDGQLKVEIKVINEQCWIRAKVDNEPSHDLTLKTGEVKEFDPKDKLELSIGETKNIELRINGKLAHFDKSVISRAIITQATASNFTSAQSNP